jgi:hypothetical protein
LDWTEGGNVRIEARWSAGDPAINFAQLLPAPRAPAM